ncbi:MAG: hypothetical protein AAB529_01915 [Patescibacteria group bacterium]
MDNLTNLPNQNTQISAIQPNKRLKASLILAVLMFLLTLAVGAFLLFYYFGRSQSDLAKNALKSISNYQANITFETQDRNFESEMIAQKSQSVFVKQKISTALPTAIINSTAPDQENTKQNIILLDGKIYIQDNYDGSYYVSSDNSLEQQFIKKISYFTPENILRLFSDSNELSIDTIPESLQKELNLTFDGNAIGKLSMNIDSKTHRISNFFLETNSKELKRVSTSFLNYNNQNIAGIDTPASVNELGSYLQRESIYIRTEKDGLYDSLWNVWEKKYFGCDHCVNKYWDEDGDGLQNIEEFIFGSNPLMKDSDLNETNDKDQLIKDNKNPVTGTSVPDVYAKSINTLNAFLNSPSQPLGTSGQTTGSTRGRDAVLMRGKDYFYVPSSAKYLNFEYKFSVKNNRNYVTLFFDNKLIYLMTLSPNENSLSETILAHVPISDFAGKSGQLMFILNSFGPPGGNFYVNLSTIRFGYSDYDYSGYDRQY